MSQLVKKYNGYEDPYFVAKRNGITLEQEWGEDVKWLYILCWKKNGLMKIGLTKPILRGRDNSILSRARTFCIQDGVPFPDRIFSTGGTKVHEAILSSLFADWRIEGRREWFLFGNHLSDAIAEVFPYFDEYLE